MTNINFRIVKLIDPKNIWSGVSETWTKDAALAGTEWRHGYIVEAFAGRQQRRVNIGKALALAS
jgi:hypothetical protein